VTLLYWDAFLGLIGIDARAGAFELSRKRESISSPWLVAVLGPVLFIQGAMLTEEFIRTQRKRS
jgi:hypothetical protein